MRLVDGLASIRERRPRVSVVGDYLLDGWWHGRADRLAREAPAPVVELVERQNAPGGAANTAMALAALGADVQAVGIIGADDAGTVLRGLLADVGVDITRLRQVPGMRTTTKVRVMAEEQVLLRLDDTEEAPWPEAAQRRFIDDAHAAAAASDAQLVCDYDSTLLTPEVVAALAETATELRVVDAHDLRKWRDLRPDAVTPNAGEAERAVGAAFGAGDERADAVAEHAESLREATGAEVVVVTLDRSGTLVLHSDGRPHRTHAHPAPEKRASGAGDVFVAALTVARVSGLSWTDAADLAQAAADVAVNKDGTCVCSLEELQDWAGIRSRQVLSHHELAERLTAHRRQGDRIVFTNGCFDMLHRGHTSYLRQARELGDVLVVAVNSNASVRRLKGPDRPVNDAVDRANVVADLAFVDYVTVFDDDTPRALIERLRPDVYAKGGDYTPEMLAETEVVRAVGGEVVIVDYVQGHSTTEMIDRMRSTGPAGRDRLRTTHP